MGYRGEADEQEDELVKVHVDQSLEQHSGLSGH